jgi:hypothetical protein
VKRAIQVTALILALACTTSWATSPMPPQRSAGDKHIFSGSVLLGYYGGAGLQATGTLSNFASGFPFEVRLGLGYNRVHGGDALLARRVFINNATNGTPRQHAKIWDARLDVMYPIKLFSLKNTKLFAGPRHSNFDTYFEYIGGAETFDVVCNQWGAGGGVETAFPLSPRVDMLVTAGADYYFRSTLSGHDTYYRPNGDDLHAIDDYTYKDADAAMNQPELEMRVMFGIGYRF